VRIALAVRVTSWEILLMRIPRILRTILIVVACLVVGAVFVVGSVWWYLHPRLERTTGVLYGLRNGKPLTIDVLRPSRPNGLGVILVASGGWKSQAGSFQPWIAAPLVRRGYSIFVAYHIPQPEATVTQIAQDINRAVRYVRHNAAKYGIDPSRLGVTGGSAGGHLSLLLATRGGTGPKGASDPVDAESSTVQAVAIFYPVTDLLNLGDSTENLRDGGPPKSFVKAFGPQATNPAIWQVIGRELSPIFFVRSNLPPILIYHGDADTLVPLDQSQRFQAEAKKLGCTVELVVHHGGKHGWPSMVWDLRQFANWFDRYLRPGSEQPPLQR
jgi:acetyl esterase/lipase